MLLIVVACFQIYEKYGSPVITNTEQKLSTKTVNDSSSSYDSTYSCDGRQYCSQMSSCEEATFFLENCPNTKMDGNYDGVPCERQHCN